MLSNESERTTESTRPLPLLESRRSDVRGDVQLCQARSPTRNRAYNEVVRRRPAVSLALPCGKRASWKTFSSCTLPSDANRKGRHICRAHGHMQGSRTSRGGAPHRRNEGVTRCNQRRKIDHYSRLSQPAGAGDSHHFGSEVTRLSTGEHLVALSRTCVCIGTTGSEPSTSFSRSVPRLSTCHSRRRRSFLQSLEPEGPLWERLMAEKRT